jgi:hypothetical protein
MRINEIAKALTGFVATAAATYQLVTQADTPGGVGITNNEWVHLVVASLLAGFAVWAIPNTPASGTTFERTEELNIRK